ncbi:phosphate signaling complex protein PhoU [Halanaerobaculum tunisiense]
MRQNFSQQLDDLRSDLVKLESMVEEAFNLAIKSLRKQREDLAKEVIENDQQIDKLQIKIEETSVRLCALQQPVANDLRTIIAISKISIDLERIGDLAQNIAQVSWELLSKKEAYELPAMLLELIDMLKTRLQQAMISFSDRQVELAYEVAQKDELTDNLNYQLVQQLLQQMNQQPQLIKAGNSLLFINRYLERIGDHITNICEQIIYMLTAKRINY